MLASIEAGNLVIAGYDIGEDDIELRRVEREGFAAQTVQIADSSVSLVLDMMIALNYCPRVLLEI